MRTANEWVAAGICATYWKKALRRTRQVFDSFERRLPVFWRFGDSGWRSDRELQLKLILKRSFTRENHSPGSNRAHGSHPSRKARGRGHVRTLLRVHEAHVATRTPVRRNPQQKMKSFFQSALRIGLPNRSALAAWTFMEPGFIPAVPEGQTHQLRAS